MALIPKTGAIGRKRKKWRRAWLFVGDHYLLGVNFGGDLLEEEEIRSKTCKK